MDAEISFYIYNVQRTGLHSSQTINYSAVTLCFSVHIMPAEQKRHTPMGFFFFWKLTMGVPPIEIASFNFPHHMKIMFWQRKQWIRIAAPRSIWLLQCTSRHAFRLLSARMLVLEKMTTNASAAEWRQLLVLGENVAAVLLEILALIGHEVIDSFNHFCLIPSRTPGIIIYWGWCNRCPIGITVLRTLQCEDRLLLWELKGDGKVYQKCENSWNGKHCSPPAKDRISLYWSPKGRSQCLDKTSSGTNWSWCLNNQQVKTFF